MITGASQGIGKAIAFGYANAGANIVCAARNERTLNAVMTDLQATGVSVLAVPTDVQNETDVKHLFTRTQETFGGHDILVINAGGNFSQGSVETSDSDGWEQTFRVNVFGAYYCMKAAIPQLKARGGGKIITLGSGLGHHGIANTSAYAASKAALWMLMQVSAQELATQNISVNELIPGPVDTGKLSEDFKTNIVKAKHEWLKQPEDVINLALFLATQPLLGPSGQSFNLMRRAY